MITGEADQAGSPGAAGEPGEIIIIVAPPGEPLAGAHGTLLLNAEFVRQGADPLLVGRDGDAGDDRIEIGDSVLARIDGGAGNDTLAFDGVLDLTMTANHRLLSIELIERHGAGLPPPMGAGQWARMLRS